MRLAKLALAGTVVGLLSTGAAYAQNGLGSASSVQQTAFEYNSYYAADDAQSPSDQAPAAPAADAAAPCNTCGNGCNDCALFPPGSMLNPCCPTGQPWKFFDDPCLKCRNINIAGYLAQSYTWNTSNPADRFNGPVTWTDRANEYQLNQAYIYAEKTTNTNGCGTDLGWRVDLMGGTDTRFTTASGLETRGQFNSPKWSTQRFYGLALPQFYLEAAVNDWKIKFGHWYAPVGYEVVMTNGNFFPSLPYTFQYGEPFTMTGAIGTYQYSETVSMGGGVMHGWDNFDNSNPNMSFIGTYTEKFSDGAALASAVTLGNEQVQSGAFRQRYLATNVYSRPLKQISDRLNYVVQSDFGWQNDALLSGKDARWYGLNQYLFYKVSDCMTYGVRAEWFRDEEGYRVGGFLGNTTDQPGAPSRGLATTRSGYAGSFYEVTMGANWKYSANTMVRPYARFDWFSGTSANGPTQRPFDGGTGNSQTLLGFDVITTF